MKDVRNVFGKVLFFGSKIQLMHADIEGKKNSQCIQFMRKIYMSRKRNIMTASTYIICFVI